MPVLWRGSDGVLSISGELIPLLEAVNERRRNAVGGVASSPLVGFEGGVMLSLSMMALVLWSLVSLGSSQPPTPTFGQYH